MTGIPVIKGAENPTLYPSSCFLLQNLPVLIRVFSRLITENVLFGKTGGKKLRSKQRAFVVIY